MAQRYESARRRATADAPPELEPFVRDIFRTTEEHVRNPYNTILDYVEEDKSDLELAGEVLFGTGGLVASWSLEGACDRPPPGELVTAAEQSVEMLLSGLAVLTADYIPRCLDPRDCVRGRTTGARCAARLIDAALRDAPPGLGGAEVGPAVAGFMELGFHEATATASSRTELPAMVLASCAGRLAEAAAGQGRRLAARAATAGAALVIDHCGAHLPGLDRALADRLDGAVSSMREGAGHDLPAGPEVRQPLLRWAWSERGAPRALREARRRSGRMLPADGEAEATGRWMIQEIAAHAASRGAPLELWERVLLRAPTRRSTGPGERDPLLDDRLVELARGTISSAGSRDEASARAREGPMPERWADAYTTICEDELPWVLSDVIHRAVERLSLP